MAKKSKPVKKVKPALKKAKAAKATKKAKPAAKKLPKKAKPAVKKAKKKAKSVSLWLDDSTDLPIIAEQAQRLETFLAAVADGVVDETEVQAQEARLVAAMKAVEPKLTEKLHAQVTQLLCELTAYDIMQMMCRLQQAKFPAAEAEEAPAAESQPEPVAEPEAVQAPAAEPEVVEAEATEASAEPPAEPVAEAQPEAPAAEQ